MTVIAAHDSRKIDANVTSTAHTSRLIHHHSRSRRPGNSATAHTRLATENSATSVIWAAKTAMAIATIRMVIITEATATVSDAAARSSDGLWLKSACSSQPAAPHDLAGPVVVAPRARCRGSGRGPRRTRRRATRPS